MRKQYTRDTGAAQGHKISCLITRFLTGPEFFSVFLGAYPEFGSSGYWRALSKARLASGASVPLHEGQPMRGMVEPRAVFSIK